ncbi:MAG: DUF2911 domain-containing protein, partial [Myxococcales bacterium]
PEPVHRRPSTAAAAAEESSMQRRRRSLRSSLAARVLSGALAFAVLVPGAASAQTAPEIPQPSPLARAQQRVGVTDFAIEYSSPAVKGRPVWGGLVPYDQLWRTGANAATRLEVSRDFTFGDKQVPAGKYAVYSIPGKTSWTVILNSNAMASGTQGYDQKNDAARVTVKPETLPNKRERLTFLFSDTTDDATNLDLEWDKLRVRVPVKVDTRSHVQASIQKSLDEAWRPHFVSARYLLDSGGDVDRALEYANTSLAIKPTWWASWVKAQLHGKKGQKAEALAAAQQADTLGKGDMIYEQFFKEQVTKASAQWK